MSLPSGPPMSQGSLSFAAVADLMSSDEDETVANFFSKRRRTSAKTTLPPAAQTSRQTSTPILQDTLQNNIQVANAPPRAHSAKSTPSAALISQTASSQIMWSSSPNWHHHSLDQLGQFQQKRAQHTLTETPDHDGTSPYFPGKLYPDLQLEPHAKPRAAPPSKPETQSRPPAAAAAAAAPAAAAAAAPPREILIDLSQNENLPEDFHSSQDEEMQGRRSEAAERDTQEINAMLQSLRETPREDLEVSILRSLKADKARPADAPTTLDKKEMKQIMLSDEQRYVLNLVVSQRKSVFFTGAAGTGKSVLLRRMIADLRRKYRQDKSKVAVTASTGVAACNVGGSTLHSFAGIGLGQEDVEKLVNRVRRNRRSLNKWRNTEVLIIDEISMIDAVLLEKLDFVARTVRRNKEPFGGIQLILTGDFFQLPPVNKEKAARFAFQANCWSDCVERTIILRKVFRQKDNYFADMLNEMRRGTLKPSTIKVFESLSRTPQVPPGVQPTRLFPLRSQVQRANTNALRNLSSQNVRYTARDQYMGHNSPDNINLDNLICVPDLSLKVGAQVMMIKNVDETLVNGTLGKVIGFMSPNAFDLLKTDDQIDLSEDELFKFSAESMGASEAAVKAAAAKSKSAAKREPSRAEIKVSRAETLTKLANQSKTLWPLVRFFMLDGTFRDVLVQPETWAVEDAEGTILAQRVQVPLMLAWALSIHKSQGQTLDWVTVDLGTTFERGQAYVALSRVTSIEGLQVLNFSPRVVMSHKQVVEFYDGLEEIGEDHLRSAGQTTIFDFANAKDEEPALPAPPIKSGSSRQILESSVTDDYLSQNHGPHSYF